MEIFTPVISICVLSLLFFIYLKVYYDISCQRIFENNDSEAIEDNDDYSLDIK